MLESCSTNQTPEQLKETFYSRKNELDSIVNKLENDTTLISLFQIGPDNGLPTIENSFPAIYTKLKKTGITDASSHFGGYHQNKNNKMWWYYFKTNWPNEYPIYLIYDAYDSSKSKKGEYKKDEVSNEWWGLGDHWTLFRLVKLKTMKQ
jgi:hypothetical protein